MFLITLIIVILSICLNFSMNIRSIENNNQCIHFIKLIKLIKYTKSTKIMNSIKFIQSITLIKSTKSTSSNKFNQYFNSIKEPIWEIELKINQIDQINSIESGKSSKFIISPNLQSEPY